MFLCFFNALSFFFNVNNIFIIQGMGFVKNIAIRFSFVSLAHDSFDIDEQSLISQYTVYSIQYTG